MAALHHSSGGQCLPPVDWQLLRGGLLSSQCSAAPSPLSVATDDGLAIVGVRQGCSAFSQPCPWLCALAADIQLRLRFCGAKPVRTVSLLASVGQGPRPQGRVESLHGDRPHTPYTCVQSNGAVSPIVSPTAVSVPVVGSHVCARALALRLPRDEGPCLSRRDTKMLANLQRQACSDSAAFAPSVHRMATLLPRYLFCSC